MDIPFTDGLFILWADNSRGKSTCMQAILYALGIEGMLGPSQEIPLPHAVKDYLEYAGSAIPVLESEVFLEIENGKSDVWTIRRQIKGSDDRRLISVWNSRFTQLNTTRAQHYYVRLPGGATRDKGFHYQLARFMDWNLPDVATYGDTSVPLYVETVFPLMFIEQKHGWQSIRGRFPTQFRIRDVGKRAIEFLLGMDAFEIATRKAELAIKTTELRGSWRVAVTEVRRLAKTANAYVDGLPDEPLSSWPPAAPVRALIPLSEDRWVTLPEAIELERAKLVELQSADIPTVGDVAAQAREQLRSLEDRLAAAELGTRQALDAVNDGRSQIRNAEIRLAALEEDLGRNQDVRKISRMTAYQELEVNTGSCPTCHQRVVDALLAQVAEARPMSLDANISFLQSQRQVFRAVLRNEVETQSVREQQLVAKSRIADQLRDEIRALKSTLVTDNRAPSYAAVAERVRLENSIKQLAESERALDEAIGEFMSLASEWRELETERAKLPKGDLSEADIRKLQKFQSLFVDQIGQFGVESVQPQEITISPDSYAPVYEGFDLQFDVSASDSIRLIWAYTLGLLEVARTEATNHLGLVLFDEPRQQSTKGASLRTFFRRSSIAANAGQQVIIATSEDRELLGEFLADIDHTLIAFPDRVIGPLVR
ncbi:MAG TPA: hypothetical protein VGC13_06420 [Longimicrobium sp.]